MGVPEGKNVALGLGVLVAVGSSVGAGVQVAGSSLRDVGVMVGEETTTGRVGGLNGLKAE